MIAGGAVGEEKKREGEEGEEERGRERVSRPQKAWGFFLPSSHSLGIHPRLHRAAKPA